MHFEQTNNHTDVGMNGNIKIQTFFNFMLA